MGRGLDGAWHAAGAQPRLIPFLPPFSDWSPHPHPHPHPLTTPPPRRGKAALVGRCLATNC